MNQEAMDALDRLDTLGVCFGAVTDLMVPDDSLGAVMRGDLAVLLDFLHTEMESAQMKLAAALKAA